MTSLANGVRLVTLSAALALPISSWAMPYTFTNIADTDGAFSFIPSQVSINNSGTVAFEASLDAGGTGIFTGNGGPTTTIAESAGPAFSPPMINDSGTVVFGRQEGIFTASGGTITAIADLSGPFDDFFNPPAINNSGTVVFGASLDAGGEVILARNGGLTTTIADTSQFPLGFSGGRNNINGSGTVEFLAFFISGNRPEVALFTGNGGPTTHIAGADDAFNAFGHASINDSGTVAFVANTLDGEWGIFTGSGGAITTIADTNGPFSLFPLGGPSINNSGAVAFTALLDVGGGAHGIFTGPDPLRDKVIEFGDALFGSTVEGVGSDEESLNENGQIAFLYTLADGRQGIARADPISSVPEPSSGSLLWFALAILALVQRRAEFKH